MAEGWWWCHHGGIDVDGDGDGDGDGDTDGDDDGGGDGGDDDDDDGGLDDDDREDDVVVDDACPAGRQAGHRQAVGEGRVLQVQPQGFQGENLFCKYFMLGFSLPLSLLNLKAFKANTCCNFSSSPKFGFVFR